MTLPMLNEAEAARDRVRRIQAGMASYVATLELVAEAYQLRDWVTLGYDSWETYVEGEFSEARVRLSREQRAEAIGSLRMAGMTTRAIGATLGVDQSTVVRDRPGDANASPAQVIGLDGKRYASTQPARPASVAVLEEDEPYEAWTPGPPQWRQPEPMPTNSAPADPYANWTAEERDLLEQMRGGHTVVVSMRGQHANLIGWAEQRDLYVRIDRRSEWGNPFELPADGDRDTVIRNYAEHYLTHKPSLLAKVTDLRGKALGCWCAPEPCHGDILKARAEV